MKEVSIISRYLPLILVLMLLVLSVAYEITPDENLANRPAYARIQQPLFLGRMQLIGEPLHNQVASSHNGSLVAVITSAGLEILERQDNTLSPLWQFSSPEESLLDVAVSGNGEWILLVSERALYLFTTASATPRHMHTFTTPCYNAKVKLSIEGSTAALLRDDSLYVYFTWSLEPRWISNVGNGPSFGLAMSENGQTIATITDSLTVYAPDAALPLWRSPLQGSSEVYVSPDGLYITLIQQPEGNQTGARIRMFSRPSHNQLWHFELESAVTNISFAENGAHLAVSTDQFYVFPCQGGWPALQHAHSGTTAFAENTPLLIDLEYLWVFDMSQSLVVSYRLPFEPGPAATAFVTGDGRWLIMLSETGCFSLIRLPDPI